MMLPGAEEAAASLAVHSFLNCYLRECDNWQVLGRSDLPPAVAAEMAEAADEAVVVTLHRRPVAVVVGLAAFSPTMRHRFELPAILAVEGASVGRLDPNSLRTLLVDDLAAAERSAGVEAGGDRPEVEAGTDTTAGVNDLMRRVLDSEHMIALSLHERAGELDRLFSAGPLDFVDTEQALLVGHMVHPTPKSRGDLPPLERMRLSPETAGSFPLAWLAVDARNVRHDSALESTTVELIAAIGDSDPEVAAALASLADHEILVPAHPWQVRTLERDPRWIELVRTGRIRPLGELGGPWRPTTSVRTVTRRGAPFQLKFSLSVGITNSVRITLPKELRRSVEAAQVAQSSLAGAIAEAAPRLHLVQDPAHLAVVDATGEVIDELSVLLRDNTWTDAPDVTALTTLCQDHPLGGPSRLVALIEGIAEREGAERSDVARRWFAQFCDIVVSGLVRLYLDVGLCFEAHQQNTLVELSDGWVVRGFYRDSQGYFHRELAHENMCAVLPGLGEVSESIFPEALADERLVYYLFLNMTIGVVNALGVGGCIDERILLGDLRDLLEAHRESPGRYPPTLLDRLLDDPVWPCKGNLRTRLAGMDELVGDIAEQSVYVTIPNPLVEAVVRG